MHYIVSSKLNTKFHRNKSMCKFYINNQTQFKIEKCFNYTQCSEPLMSSSTQLATSGIVAFMIIVLFFINK